MESRDSLWPTVMGYILWAVSATVGLGVLFAAIELVEQVSWAIIVPGCDPLKAVECQGTLRTVMMIAYMALGIIWLVWYIMLVEGYTRSKTAVVLARRFAITTGIQSVIVIVWLIVTKVIII
ncbi:MAG: hypothetical protein R6X16_16900 [Anaerolineae bacterium]